MSLGSRWAVEQNMRSTASHTSALPGGPLRHEPRTEYLKDVAVILFDYGKKHSREDVPEQQVSKAKKYNKGWENVRKRNRERHADVLRREMEL